MPTMKFLSQPSGGVKADERGIVPVSFTLEVTEQEMKLFCYAGTDIFCHEYIDGHPRPPREDVKVYDNGLRPGATTVAIIDDKWLFAGDFDHVDEQIIKENAKRLRAMLEEMRQKSNSKRPFALHKDYYDRVYPVEASPAEWLERHNKYESYEPLMPWEQFETYNPPPTYFEKDRQEKLEFHKIWAEQNGCPICANREYLESLGVLEPKKTGKHDIDYHLAMNLDSHDEADWARNWLILHNQFQVDHSPKCTVCQQPILQSVYFGIDSWVERAKSGFCDDHDPKTQRFRQEMAMEELKKKKKQSRTVAKTPNKPAELAPLTNFG